MFDVVWETVTQNPLTTDVGGAIKKDGIDGGER